MCVENTVLLLKEIGMHSEWVLNGADAVVYVESAHKRHLDYNAVILDWQMPDMDGIETARRIRNKVGDTFLLLLFSAPMTGQRSRMRLRRLALRHF